MIKSIESIICRDLRPKKWVGPDLPFIRAPNNSRIPISLTESFVVHFAHILLAFMIFWRKLRKGFAKVTNSSSIVFTQLIGAQPCFHGLTYLHFVEKLNRTTERFIVRHCSDYWTNNRKHQQYLITESQTYSSNQTDQSVHLFQRTISI